MLKWPEDVIQEFPVILRTNRDAENPALIEYVKSRPVDSLLDVGAHNSWANYAPELRKLVKKYEAIDILKDPQTEAIVDHYFVGNANLVSLDKYDMVISVSVFEHAGISTYLEDHDSEVLRLFEHCLGASKKYVWVSFDVGQPWLTEGQHSPITKDLWDEMLYTAKDYKVNKRFFYTQGSQMGHPWIEHSKEDIAFKIPYIDYIGNQSIAVLEIEK